MHCGLDIDINATLDYETNARLYTLIRSFYWNIWETLIDHLNKNSASQLTAHLFLIWP